MHQVHQFMADSKIPFSVFDRVDKPISIYAASKLSNELIAHSYNHLFGLNSTGLRFFTVYGPWGRPDMAMYIFANNIIQGNQFLFIIMEICNAILLTLMI